MADCAAVGCSQPALHVWRPSHPQAPRFHYLVCEYHGQALRSEVRHRIDGDELHIDSLPRLLDWSLTPSAEGAIVRVSYGDDLETVTVNLHADPAMLRRLTGSLDATQADDGRR